MQSCSVKNQQILFHVVENALFFSYDKLFEYGEVSKPAVTTSAEV